MTDSPKHIVVCSLTFKRPAGLRTLLDSIAAMAHPANTTCSVLIVDNDPEGSAQEQIETLAQTYPVPLTYVLETTPGISAARNRGIAEIPDADFVAFIDDDEWVDPQWLVELFATHETVGADVVTGPVLPEFETPPPEWILKGEFFDRPRPPHNSLMTWATTSSVLISRAALDAVEGPFDLAFGLSGGSDTHYFEILNDMGFVMAWSDRAIVYETVHESRANLKWILRREYRRGQVLGRTLRARQKGPAKLAKRGVRGGLEILRGIAETPLGLLRNGKAGALLGIHRVALGTGMITGLAGRHYDEYLAGHHGQ